MKGIAEPGCRLPGRQSLSPAATLGVSASGRSAGYLLVLGLMGSAAWTSSTALFSRDSVDDTDQRHQYCSDQVISAMMQDLLICRGFHTWFPGCGFATGGSPILTECNRLVFANVAGKNAISPTPYTQRVGPLRPYCDWFAGKSVPVGQLPARTHRRRSPCAAPRRTDYAEARRRVWEVPQISAAVTTLSHRQRSTPPTMNQAA